MHSAMYSGSVHHKRLKPVSHAFSYTLFMMYLDLDELDAVLQQSLLLSRSHWAPLQFKRSDFHKNESESIKESVYNTVSQQIGLQLSGPVRVLANWRCFGVNFNPLTTYYCFDEQGETLQAVVAEVTNTPWLERHPYVVDARHISPQDAHEKQGKAITQATLDKVFTVSPFNPLNMQYRWSSSVPSETLKVAIGLVHDNENMFSASMSLSRKALTKKNIRQAVFSFPFMTCRVIFRIYWQALRLYLKGVPFLGKDKHISSV